MTADSCTLDGIGDGFCVEESTCLTEHSGPGTCGEGLLCCVPSKFPGCYNRCGETVGSCKCDVLCEGYGDCCGDYSGRCLLPDESPPTSTGAGKGQDWTAAITILLLGLFGAIGLGIYKCCVQNSANTDEHKPSLIISDDMMNLPSAIRLDKTTMDRPSL